MSPEIDLRIFQSVSDSAMQHEKTISLTQTIRAPEGKQE
jgi:hypothetical protein